MRAMSILSVVFGSLSLFVFTLVLSPLGVVLACAALAMRDVHDRLTRTLAQVGLGLSIVCGIMGVILGQMFQT